jgi:hypothetical protein
MKIEMMMVVVFIFAMNFVVVAGAQDRSVRGTVNDPFQVQQGFRPVPDPTDLTTKALADLKTVLIELFEARLETVKRKADHLEFEVYNRPLITLVDEKFKAVSEQFAARDAALAAALLAQKSLVDNQNNSNLAAADKTEKSFIEQLKGIQALLVQQDKASTDKIGDLKDRLATSEATLAARLTVIEAESRGSGIAINWIVVAAGFVFTIISIIGAIMGIVAMMKTKAAPMG